MHITLSDIKPIYLQIAEGIEDDILNGILEEDQQAYSQSQIAKKFNINPATAGKGLSILVKEGILYKQRGLGMYVSEGAKKVIREKRKNQFLGRIIKEVIVEAKKLGIRKEEIKQMIDHYTEGHES